MPTAVLTGALVIPADTDGDAADCGLAGVRLMLDLARDWLARPSLTDARLVVVTRGAVALSGDDPRPESAAVWGAIRGAQAENPGRFMLLDLAPGLDAETDIDAIVADAVASGEPETVLRAGRMLSPRLVRAGAGRTAAAGRPPGHDGLAALDPDGTVLITGGTGTLGGLIAEHLARTGRVRNLLLVSRRGKRAPGADQLVGRLAGAGAHATVAAVDVADPAAVARLIDGIDPLHPITGVVHAVRASGDLSAEWAQAKAAANLHVATAGLRLGMFVVFSAAGAILGCSATAGHEAADAFCAALVTYRRAAGLPGKSLAWGPAADRNHQTERPDCLGIQTLNASQVPAVLEAVADHGADHLVAARVDTKRLSRQPADTLPAALRSLATLRATARSAAAGPPPADWSSQLTGLPSEEQHRILLNLVRAQAAAVLRQTDPGRIEPERGFLDIGVDSLTAVELRNRLASATGLRLPPTLVFDHGSPDQLAAYLHAELVPHETDALAPVLTEIDRLERSVFALSRDDAARAALATRLRLTTSRLESWGGRASDTEMLESGADRIRSASADQLLDFIDRNLGRIATS